MAKQTQKLQSYLTKYLGKPENYVYESMGKPLQFPERDILFYQHRKRIIFLDEIAFSIQNGKVKDIMLSEYVFGIAVRNIFYYPENNASYKVVNLFKHQLLRLFK